MELTKQHVLPFDLALDEYFHKTGSIQIFYLIIITL